MSSKPLGTVAVVLAVVLSSTVGILAVAPEPVAAQSWSIEVVNDDDWAEQAVEMDIESDGNPHVVYFTDDGLVHSQSDGRGWTRERITDGIGSDRAGTLDYKIDRGDVSRISFYGQAGESLFYAQSSGGAWDVRTLENFRDEVTGQQNSIAIEESGRPHIAYFGQGDAKYRVMSRSGWRGGTIQADIGVTKFGYGGIAIAVASDGTPHVVYYNRGGFDLEYARWNGEDWVHEEIDTERIAGSTLDMALDSAGRPHLVYQVSYNEDGSRKRLLRYAHWTGSDWAMSTIDPDGGMWPSIALDADGNPHISYRIAGGRDADRLQYARLEESEWTLETVETSSAIYESSITIDRRGTIYIGYISGSTVKHAKRLVIDVPVGVCVTCESGLGTWLAGNEDVMVHVSPSTEAGTDSYYFVSLHDGEVETFESVAAPDERDETLNVYTDDLTAFEIASASDRRAAAQAAYVDGDIKVKPVGLGNQVKYGIVGFAVDVYSFGQGLAKGISNVF